jgi:hypothetical protein
MTDRDFFERLSSEIFCDLFVGYISQPHRSAAPFDGKADSLTIAGSWLSLFRLCRSFCFVSCVRARTHNSSHAQWVIKQWERTQI